MELYLMADWGYSIKKQLEPLAVTLNIPSFSAWKGQLSQEEVTESQTTAAAGIQRIKYFWQIRNEIPLAMHGSINQFVIFSHYIYKKLQLLLHQVPSNNVPYIYSWKFIFAESMLHLSDMLSSSEPYMFSQGSKFFFLDTKIRLQSWYFYETVFFLNKVQFP